MFKFSNIHKPSSAKIIKISIGLTSGATALGTYGHFSDNSILAYIGAVATFIGASLPHFFSDNTTNQTN